MTWSNLQIPNLFICILLFCKLLMYFIVFISGVFHCFLWFFFGAISSWLVSRYKKLCRWPNWRNKHAAGALHRKSVISRCFVHKHVQNADYSVRFWARRASTNCHVTSRPMVQYSQTWYQQDALDLKEKRHEKASRDQRQFWRSRGIRAGGGLRLRSNWPPPPPVKLGLKAMDSMGMWWKANDTYFSTNWIIILPVLCELLMPCQLFAQKFSNCQEITKGSECSGSPWTLCHW